MDTITSSDGTPIAFERTGSGPPLLLVHGNADVPGFWDLAGVRSDFSESHTVYAMERRVRGRSGDSPDYSLGREAEDVAAVIDSIDKAPTVLGHSAGAVYALEAALETDHLHRLILNQPPIAVGRHELDVAGAVAGLEELLENGEEASAVGLFLEEVAQLSPDELEEVQASPVWDEMVEAAPVLPRELRALSRYRFEEERFQDLTVPALVLVGRESPPFYRDAAQAVADALPNGRLGFTPGHTHEPMNTTPGPFVEQVEAFI